MPAKADQTPRLCRVAGRDTWHVYANGKRTSTGETRREDAERFLADMVAGARQPRQPAASFLADLLARYLADRRQRAIVGADRLGYAHKALCRRLGTRLPETITAADCRAYAVDRATDGVTPATIRTELQALRAALRWAVASGAVALPRAPDVPLPPRPAPRQRWLTRDEAGRLATASAHRHVRLFIALALHTAARKGAILALTWDRVDLPGRVIDFTEPGRAVTRKRRVRVPINDTLLEALTAARGVATCNHVIEYGGGPAGDVKHGFASAAARAGLADVTPHTMRHTAVTWLMQAGVSPWQVAGMAGMTLEMVQSVYGHHDPAFLRDAANALG